MSMVITSAIGEVWLSEQSKPLGISFVDFVNEHSVALQRFAYLVTGNYQDAQDLVQEVFVGLYPKWEKVAARGDISSYVRRSIVNRHVSAWRKQHRSIPVPDVTAFAEPNWEDASAEHTDTGWGMRLCMQLPAKQRVVVILRVFEGFSYAEIAEICGCSQANVRTRAHRGLATLKKRYENGEHNE